MSDMVERVARAITKRRAEEVGGCDFDVCDDDYCQCLEDARIDARAAIEAMDTPTAAMLSAGVPERSQYGLTYAECCWRGMIQEALKE